MYAGMQLDLYTRWKIQIGCSRVLTLLTPLLVAIKIAITAQYRKPWLLKHTYPTIERTLFISACSLHGLDPQRMH